jgi:hypothetical protein
MNRIGWLVLITLFATLFAPPTLAHESRAALAAGPKHSDICTSPSLVARRRRSSSTARFAMLHSFWFPQATEAFIAIRQREPDCAMAHWGVAMSQRVQRVRAFVGTR